MAQKEECMVFSEFTEKVREKITDYLPEFDTESVSIKTIEKNNGVSCTGLLIREKGENVAPNIYLEYYFARYTEGCAFDGVLREIAKEYRDIKNTIINTAVSEFDKAKARDKVIVKLVNYRDNRKLLKDCPYIRFNDLAVMARFVVALDETGISSTPLTNDDLTEWGISKEELFKKALDNTKRLLPPKVFKMDELINRSTGVWLDGEFETQAYVITNKICVNGATVVLYKEVMEEFEQKFPEGFYILPSSIHEVIVLPASVTPDKSFLRELVREVNRDVLPDTDYLSDEVYYYDAEEKNITL